MKDQELKDLFHAYRPDMGDEDAFMDKLCAQMDVTDAKQQPARVIPLYRKFLPWVTQPWVAGITAAVAVAVVLVVKGPVRPADKPYVQSRLPEYYQNKYPIYSDPASFDDIVNEIETSGRQLEQAIAQL